MLKMSRKVVMVMAAASLFAFNATAASGKGANVEKGVSKPSAATNAVAAVATAHALVRYGDANKDVLALITAGKMLREIGSRSGDVKRTGGKGATKAGGDMFAADAVLARAKTLAAGRADLVALVDDAAKAGTRGRDAGPLRHRDVVLGGDTDTYVIRFTGGEPARILVSGDGDSDLDLYVYDEYGNLGCRDADNTDDMICGFTPRRTGPFTVRIKNLGVANSYIMLTN